MRPSLEDAVLVTYPAGEPLRNVVETAAAIQRLMMRCSNASPVTVWAPWDGHEIWELKDLRNVDFHTYVPDHPDFKGIFLTVGGSGYVCLVPGEPT